MRIKNSIINVLISMLAQSTTVILGFITQKIFIGILGTEILGINGLFSNVISMLAIAELGMGTAVIYNLYKPIAEKNEKKIRQLMNFYKSCYRIVATTIVILGLAIMPFISFFVGEVNTSYNIYIIYIVFLLDTVISYLFAYKRSILYADQKNYIINIIHVLYLILTNVSQIIVLQTTQNYIVYLAIRTIMRLLENVLINIITIRKYPYIKEKEKENLDKKEKTTFYKGLKGLVLHKVSWIVIGGTDNLVISGCVGINWVGIYSNYLLITNTIEQFVAQMFSSITGSVGNLLAKETKEKAYEVYKRADIFQFVICSTATVEIFCASEAFIKIWLGDSKFLLPTITVFCISIAFFLSAIRRNICVFKDAAGIFYEDRIFALIATIINIIFSIVLAIFIGINGVIIGTIICYTFLHIFSYSKNIYKKVFGRKKSEYIVELIKYCILVIMYMLISKMVIKILPCSNAWVEFIKTVIISIVIPNIITIALYKNTEEFKYWKQLAKEIINKIIHNKKYVNL